jgi:hypothetical protein
MDSKRGERERKGVVLFGVGSFTHMAMAMINSSSFYFSISIVSM